MKSHIDFGPKTLGPKNCPLLICLSVCMIVSSPVQSFSQEVLKNEVFRDRPEAKFLSFIAN